LPLQNDLDYHRLNQVIGPVVAAMPDEVSLLEQINKATNAWYADIDLANVLLSIRFKRRIR